MDTTYPATEASGGLADYSDVAPPKAALGRYVSLYAGAGGLDLGFALAGFAPVWVSELDKDALATHHEAFRQLRENYAHLREHDYDSHVGDLLEVDENDLPTVGSAELVIGGPPCQGFSVAGKMDPEDPRSKHVFHFFDIVERVEPKAFVLENVKALYANRRWSAIREALVERAERLNYAVKVVLVNAADFGVPQARERMLILGTRKDIGLPVAPRPTTADRRPTVREVLAQLPAYGLPGNDSFCTAKVTAAKSPVLRKSPFAGMLFNGAGRPLDLDAPSPTLPASMGGNRTPIIDQNFAAGRHQEPWVVEYHRTLWGSKAPIIAEDVPPHLRRLTVEEAAAIQTFPLGMHWAGPQSSKFRQIGNAVPPRLGLAIGRAVAESIGNHQS